MDTKFEVRNQIEMLRTELNNAIDQVDDLKLYHVITLSQRLDDIIIEYCQLENS